MRCIERRTLGAASRSLRPRTALTSPDLYSYSAPECVLVVVSPPPEGYVAVKYSAVRLFGFELSFGLRASRSER